LLWIRTDASSRFNLTIQIQANARTCQSGESASFARARGTFCQSVTTKVENMLKIGVVLETVRHYQPKDKFSFGSSPLINF